MKYVVLLCDGMADYPLEELDGKTPMSCAKKPNMERLAKRSEVGLVKTVADGLKPGSDVANLSVLGYDPAIYYSGRSPLEAASIGIDLKETDVTFRCNLVTLSDEPEYTEKTMVDYCADDISTAEAAELIGFIQEQFGNETFSFFPGVSYRHCLVWNNGTTEVGTLTPPHDISGRKITEYLSDSPQAEKLIGMMKKSYDLLKNHPVNQARIAAGHRPANSIWLWGEGRKKTLMPFKEKYGVKGAMISAVDLLKGIGKLSDMEVLEVEGATGYIDTNFEGKAQAAIQTLKNGNDFVYIHVEAPDECGHRFEIQNKVRAIEYIDEKILGPLLQALDTYDDYKVMILPDHPTPLALKTHTADPVPYMIYHKRKERSTPIACFDEMHAKAIGIYEANGPSLMERFIKE